MAGQRDYYEVLGVPRDADAKTIKNAFRQLARRYHPDASTEPDAEEHFKEIAEAYGVLSDPAKRASYDSRGFAGLAGATPQDLWGGIDFGDIFGEAAGFGGLFERLFGGQASPGPQRGSDIHLELTVPLRQVLEGGRQAVTITRPGPCSRCSGSGARSGTVPRACPDCGGAGQRTAASRRGTLLIRQVSTCEACHGRGSIIDQLCPACHGSGRAAAHEKVTVRIPPGIPDGAALRLAGRGMPSPAGGQPGDAYVIIRAEADPRFTRSGADLWHDLHIPVADAALGTTASVPAPDGAVRVVVPAGTQPGAVLQVAGKGLPRYRGHGRGDLNVGVSVDIPQQLTPRQRQLYEQLREEHATGSAKAAGSRSPQEMTPQEMPGPARPTRHPHRPRFRRRRSPA